MSLMVRAGCRVFQTTIKYAARVLPWRQPEIIRGENSVLKLPQLLAQKQIKRVFVVTDAGLMKIGLPNRLLDGLRKAGITVVLYDQTQANPTIGDIEQALMLYEQNQCEAIIAFGGGSPIDCAKAVGARVARPLKPVQKMKGLFKVLHKLPPLFAVPTTSGTGSEATLAAVVVDEHTHEKYAVNDLSLIPCVAVLDPVLTKGLPPPITAATGMDALTHAVEAYIGHSNTNWTQRYAREATKRIFRYLPVAYTNADNRKARTEMQLASYMAGVAFTRAFVGNVHAIAHTLGGFYSVPHGYANAVILPYVLEYYGETPHKPLAELAELAGVASTSSSEADKANNFIEAIRTMNQDMGIPDKIEGIKKEDIPAMVENAYHEANPLYPVPQIFSRKDFTNIYEMISL